MASRALASLALVATLGCNGPTLLFPGGRLDGELRPTPADWSFAGEYGTAQLETRPEDPYSVNVAYTIVGEHLYVNAGNTEARWVKNIAADPSVRLRIDDALYELRADRVSDEREIARFGEAWTSQSWFLRDPTQFDEVWIYRLVAR